MCVANPFFGVISAMRIMCERFQFPHIVDRRRGSNAVILEDHHVTSKSHYCTRKSSKSLCRLEYGIQSERLRGDPALLRYCCRWAALVTLLVRRLCCGNITNISRMVDVYKLWR